MPKYVLKHESHYRAYGAVYDSIGRVDPDGVDAEGNRTRFVYEGPENPDPLHFEELVELPAALTRPVPVPAPVTDESDKETD